MFISILLHPCSDKKKDEPKPEAEEDAPDPELEQLVPAVDLETELRQELGQLR